MVRSAVNVSARASGIAELALYREKGKRNRRAQI